MAVVANNALGVGRLRRRHPVVLPDVVFPRGVVLGAARLGAAGLDVLPDGQLHHRRPGDRGCQPLRQALGEAHNQQHRLVPPLLPQRGVPGQEPDRGLRHVGARGGAVAGQLGRAGPDLRAGLRHFHVVVLDPPRREASGREICHRRRFHRACRELAEAPAGRPRELRGRAEAALPEGPDVAGGGCGGGHPGGGHPRARIRRSLVQLHRARQVYQGAGEAQQQPGSPRASAHAEPGGGGEEGAREARHEAQGPVR
mmetsp:Transcript_100997/g.308851  ORF Transcript_100997/g.308851 Transcript_100997/m.308851 type:complete len:255 (-) Transcript_100997:464-1228(-)